jgi:hypothetical protein
MIDSVTVHGDHAHRVAFQRFAIPSDEPSLERVVAALRIENARLARELAEAGAVTARLRTQLAAKRARPASPEDAADYEPHDAHAANAGTHRGWLYRLLKEKGGTWSVEGLMRASGRSRQAVHNAVFQARALLIVEGRKMQRSYALRADA